MHFGGVQGFFWCIIPCSKIRQQEKCMLPVWLLSYWLLWLEPKSTFSIYWIPSSTPMSLSLDVMCLPIQTGCLQHPTLHLRCSLMCPLRFNAQQTACCLYIIVILIHSVPVQCPAISSLQSDRHMQSSRLLLFPHASDKMCTSLFARKGLNLIWVTVGFSSALNSVGWTTWTP
jgi:hypothetical protein